MKILLLSAYHAYSHRIWCEQLMAQFPEYEWKLLSLPPRFFSWRIRGNSLLWRSNEYVALQQHYNLIIATSMTDLNGLTGFFPHLSAIPSILYFHENQFDYPLSNEAGHGVEPRLVQLYAALTAKQLVFNSEYNRTTFVAGVKQLLTQLPDNLPADLVEDIASRALVLPVPVHNDFFLSYQTKHSQFSLVWNHRWEYDKWPECFYKALQQFSADYKEFELYLFGQRFRQKPAAFEALSAEFGDQIKHVDWVEDRNEYLALISRCHVAVSTARHDFQGLAMIEAAASGVSVLVPDRLSYPEWFSKEGRYESIPEDLEHQSYCLSSALLEFAERFAAGQALPQQDVSQLSWLQLKSKYKTLIENHYVE